MKTGIAVVDAMNVSVISITGQFSVYECAKVMAANKIGAVVVTDGEKNLGIITERDIVRKAAAKALSMHKVFARDIMERKVITISPKADIYDAMIAMRDHDIRHLPVVNNGDLVGFLTMKDILKIEPELFELVAEHYEMMQNEGRPKRSFFEPRDEIENTIDD